MIRKLWFKITIGIRSLRIKIRVLIQFTNQSLSKLDSPVLARRELTHLEVWLAMELQTKLNKYKNF